MKPMQRRFPRNNSVLNEQLDGVCIVGSLANIIMIEFENKDAKKLIEDGIFKFYYIVDMSMKLVCSLIQRH